MGILSNYEDASTIGFVLYNNIYCEHIVLDLLLYYIFNLLF